ncbi:MAG: sugar hydrolase [Flaviaesturariibacter sp.]|nr:sugar hydrolase [Flaviaesturariibacter sp.]
MRTLASLLLIFLSLTASSQSRNWLTFVNPLIGTEKMGHTYPGATVPFGMVQLSPDTDTIPLFTTGKYNPDVYKYCAGYQYDDPTIVGFSHTHFSGTGHSDLGDFLVMPTSGPLQVNPGTEDHPETGYRSRFSHSNETASPGFYGVLLDDHGIRAELTTTTRVGVHRYTFQKTDSAHIILDLAHGIYNYEDKNVWTYLHVVNDTLVTGYRQTNGWARTRTIYFALTFSRPFRSHGARNLKPGRYNGFWGRFNQARDFPEAAAPQLRAWFDFQASEGEAIGMKLALSPVSMENALENLRTEAPRWNFDEIRSAAATRWNEELGKIAVTMSEPADMTNFYTALYHSFLGPTVYMDVNGQYKGVDQAVHTASGFTNYSTFSLWDTYRALHPLFNMIQPARNRDMIRSMLAHQEQSPEHMLPVWSHHGNENWCMSGYHSVSVIADAIAKKNLAGIDAEKALDACVQTAHTGYYDGVDWYEKLGYVPEDKKGGTSVSTTLEYAYDDWCIAQAAQALGRTGVFTEFSRRAQSWRNVYDPSTGFMRPRLSDGSFRQSFDVLSTNGQGFIEGNAWNYSLFVPHDPRGLIEIMGGSKRFVPHLDSLFTMHLPDAFFAETEDITREGIIGNYVHGNEPSHHVAYLYNSTDQPWKTQGAVRNILRRQYHPAPDGLGGNDDCGQMSAWYVFSALGFYPVAPGSDLYEIGSPLVRTASIRNENGTTFSIEARNAGPANMYIQRMELNGKAFRSHTLRHSDIVRGGTLIFWMGPKPMKTLFLPGSN